MNNTMHHYWGQYNTTDTTEDKTENIETLTNNMIVTVICLKMIHGHSIIWEISVSTKNRQDCNRQI